MIFQHVTIDNTTFFSPKELFDALGASNYPQWAKACGAVKVEVPTPVGVQTHLLMPPADFFGTIFRARSERAKTIQAQVTALIMASIAVDGARKAETKSTAQPKAPQTTDNDADFSIVIAAMEALDPIIRLEYPKLQPMLDAVKFKNASLLESGTPESQVVKICAADLLRWLPDDLTRVEASNIYPEIHALLNY